MTPHDGTGGTFGALRGRLFGVAHRMLGSIAEAGGRHETGRCRVLCFVTSEG